MRWCPIFSLQSTNPMKRPKPTVNVSHIQIYLVHQCHIASLLFKTIPKYKVSCHKYPQNHQMGMNPPLKIVPNKCPPVLTLTTNYTTQPSSLRKGFILAKKKCIYSWPVYKGLEIEDFEVLKNGWPHSWFGCFPGICWQENPQWCSICQCPTL